MVLIISQERLPHAIELAGLQQRPSNWVQNTASPNTTQTDNHEHKDKATKYT